MQARRSIPAEPAVAYSGKGHWLPKRGSSTLASSLFIGGVSLSFIFMRTLAGRHPGDHAINQLAGQTFLGAMPTIPVPVRRIDGQGVVLAFKAGAAAYPVGRDQIQLLAAQPGARARFQRPGFGGKANHQARALFADRKSTRLNSSHVATSYAVFCWTR